MPRREVKFVFRATDLGKLRSILRTNFRRALFGNAPSIIRSLYFDDAALRAFHDSVEGVGARRKLRLRWYNSNEHSLFFEVKEREFDLVSKRRVAIGSDTPLSSLRYRDVLAELRALLEPPEGELLASQDHPILICEYTREYYEGPGGLRVTLDFDLGWFEQLGALRPRCRFGVHVPRTVILEVKAPVGGSVEIAPLLHPLRVAVTRSSKYVVGCEQLGLSR
ncbi:MAG TPA: polyphosphate polymerase domain-containing protein [Vicinamibacteria bacterium]|nr:polyphosphate polymerase domain-containing protein [Vicinamibacteria bacterium]